LYVNETYDAETETIPRRWSDETETLEKNASRPSQNRDVRDRDYNPEFKSGEAPPQYKIIN